MNERCTYYPHHWLWFALFIAPTSRLTAYNLFFFFLIKATGPPLYQRFVCPIFN